MRGDFFSKIQKAFATPRLSLLSNFLFLHPCTELAVPMGVIFISKRKKTCESSHKSFLSVHLPPNDASMGANFAHIFLFTLTLLLRKNRLTYGAIKRPNLLDALGLRRVRAFNRGPILFSFPLRLWSERGPAVLAAFQPSRDQKANFAARTTSYFL